MPTSAIVDDEAVLLTPRLTVEWLYRGRCVLPPCTLEQLVRFLWSHDVLYGPTGQAAFCEQLVHFLGREPPAYPPTSRGFRDDWGHSRRQAFREANEALAVGYGSMDCGQSARLELQRPDDAHELSVMADLGEFRCIHGLLDGAVELDSILFLGETHARDEHPNVQLLQGVCAHAGRNRVVRVLLDGVAASAGDAPLDLAQVQRNYANVDDALFARCEWFGIEPAETEMLTVCEDIRTIRRTREDFRAAIMAFLAHLEHNQEYGEVLGEALTACDELVGRMRACMLTGEASRLQDGINAGRLVSSPLPRDLQDGLRALASGVEWANHATIRMDAHVEWTRTIERVAALPTVVMKAPVSVVVLCGMNHLLMRQPGSVPVQAMLDPDTVMSFCVTDDALTMPSIRRCDESLNYVTTLPAAWVTRYFTDLRASDEAVARINRIAEQAVAAGKLANKKPG